MAPVIQVVTAPPTATETVIFFGILVSMVVLLWFNRERLGCFGRLLMGGFLILLVLAIFNPRPLPTTEVVVVITFYPDSVAFQRPRSAQPVVVTRGSVNEMSIDDWLFSSDSKVVLSKDYTGVYSFNASKSQLPEITEGMSKSLGLTQSSPHRWTR